MLGEPKRVIDAYLQDVAEKQEEDFLEKKDAAVPSAAVEGAREQRWGKREIEIRKVVLRGAGGEEKHVFAPDESLAIELDVAAVEPQKDFVFGIGVFNSLGTLCYGTNTDLEDLAPESIQGQGKVVCRIDKLGLINGTYYLDVAVHKRDGYPFDYHKNLYSFLVSSTKRDEGVARLPHRWEFGPAIGFKKAGK
jgi:hypothetical protein